MFFYAVRKGITIITRGMRFPFIQFCRKFIIALSIGEEVRRIPDIISKVNFSSEGNCGGG